MLVDSLRSFKSKLQSKLNSHDKRAKIQDTDFIIGLLQAVATAKDNFSLAELRLSVCQFIEISIGHSAFNERLGTASLVQHLRLALGVLIQSVGSRNTSIDAVELAEKLGVKEIIGVDGSMVTLWDGLSDIFKGTFMEAAVKLHMATDLVTGSVAWFDFTPGATHDSKRFPEIREGTLYIIDLGYWSMKLLQQISDQSAFFLSRVKGKAKFKVSKVIYGIGQSAVGSDLLRIPIKNKRGNIIEVYATTPINGVEVVFRLLGFWNKEKRSYHWYVTNLKGSRKIIGLLYRLRWQIELSFKAMKSTLNFDRIPTINKNAVESFLLIGVINYVFSVILRQEAEAFALATKSKQSKKSSIQKSAKAFREGVRDILSGLKIGRRMTKSWIEKLEEKLKLLLESVFDPNQNRRKSTVADLLTA